MPESDSPRKFTGSRASVLLDLIRGLAAVLVLVEHWRLAFFQDYQQLEPASWPAKIASAALYVVTAAGHQAVVIFFVLSGYLISKAVFRMHRENRWSWRVYLLHRLARLWTVLLPGLFLCLLWDKLGLRFGYAPLLYAGQATNHLTGNVAGSLSAKVFLENLFFILPITGPTYGSDGALWSLPYEFWYYILFPLALIVVVRSSSTFARFLHGALFLAFAWLVRGDLLWMFPIWLLGTLLARVKPFRVNDSVKTIAGVFFLLITFVAAKVPVRFERVNDYVYGICCAIVLWLFLGALEPVSDRATWVKSSRALSRFSYTLYVAHTPILIFAVALLAGENRWRFTVPHFSVALLVLVLVTAYCWIVALLTEFRTDTVRSFASRFVLGHKERTTPHEAALAASGPDITTR